MMAAWSDAWSAGSGTSTGGCLRARSASSAGPGSVVRMMRAPAGSVSGNQRIAWACSATSS